MATWPSAGDNSKATVLVHDMGRWSRCSPTERDPTDIAVEDLLASARPSPPGPPAGAPTSGAWVRPVGPVTLLAVDGAVLATDRRDGDVEELFADELRILDALTETRSVDDLRADVVATDLDASLRRLAGLGLVHLEDTKVVVYDVGGAVLSREHHFVRPGDHWRELDPHRIPVLPAYAPQFGAPLALGMITARARTWEGGRLAERFDIRPPLTLDEVGQVLAQHQGPAVLLCSNYLWSSESNLELAASARAANPELVVVHGGPDTPKYDEDLGPFLTLEGVDIAVQGEGEDTACELLAALGDAEHWGDLRGLASVPGLAFWGPGEASFTKTEARDRRADLNDLPSPYLSGEFDDLHPVTWGAELGATCVIETNRGCPYKCTFCDWGSATMSRIRHFDLDRVEAEMRWLADRQAPVWMLADANVGIVARDLDVARMVASLREETGMPTFLGINTAKNTTRHLPAILRTLLDAGVSTFSSLSLQTRDEDTLRAVRRTNIAPERYDELCTTFRELGLPVMCDLVLGLPGATPASFKDDLQWALDSEITARVWPLQLLPNAPMNDPAYRAEYAIEVDPDGGVRGTISFDRADYDHMFSLRMANRTFEHFGLLRHVLRWVQWDHGIRAVDVMDDLVRRSENRPEDYPLLNWVLRYFDYFPIPPMGWHQFYGEVRRYLIDELGIPPGPAMDAALAVQQALMPERERSYPASVELAHDYEAYYRSATAADATGPDRPRLEDFPATTFTVIGDPAELAVHTFRRLEDLRPSPLVMREFWVVLHFELDSPLTRFVAEVRANPQYQATTRLLESVPAAVPHDVPVAEIPSTPIELGPVRRPRSPEPATPRRWGRSIRRPFRRGAGASASPPSLER